MELWLAGVALKDSNKYGQHVVIPLHATRNILVGLF